MGQVLRMIFIALIAVMGMMINHDISSKAQTLHYLKEDLEIAVHDASLEVSEEDLKNGRFLFNRTEAMNTFRETFEKNSRLSSGEYEIVGFEYFDDTSQSFPIEYSSDVADFNDVFHSPTILATVKTKKDAYFSKSSNDTFTQVASYSYKVNRAQSGFPSDEVIGLPNANGFVWPVPYTSNITSHFGMRIHPITGLNTLHAGMDIASPGVSGSPTVSAKEGTVVYASPLGGYGNLVIVDHGGGVETRYAHLTLIQATVGQSVTAGQVIGTVGTTGGSTGPHLHFEVRVDGKPYNPTIFYP